LKRDPTSRLRRYVGTAGRASGQTGQQAYEVAAIHRWAHPTSDSRQPTTDPHPRSPIPGLLD
jgi:hypothetical protein